MKAIQPYQHAVKKKKKTVIDSSETFQIAWVLFSFPHKKGQMIENRGYINTETGSGTHQLAEQMIWGIFRRNLLDTIFAQNEEAVNIRASMSCQISSFLRTNKSKHSFLCPVCKKKEKKQSRTEKKKLLSFYI